MAKDLAKLHAADVARHNTRKKAWIVIHGIVWDVTGPCNKPFNIPISEP